MLEERIAVAKLALREEFEAYVQELTVRTIKITVNGRTFASAEAIRHCNFDDLLADVCAFEATKQNERANFWLVGEAGTAKRQRRKC